MRTKLGVANLMHDFLSPQIDFYLHTPQLGGVWELQGIKETQTTDDYVFWFVLNCISKKIKIL